MRRIPIPGSFLLLAAALAGCGGPSPRVYAPDVLEGDLRVAVIPLANYSPTRDAADRLGPLIEVELAGMAHVTVVDPGRVEAVLATEPWLLTDRLPPDLVDAFGEQLGADALMVGSVLAYGYRDGQEGEVPQVSLSLRMIESPGGRVLWSGVHGRDGEDGETVFGFGRVEALEQLALETVRQLIATFPRVEGGVRPARRERMEEERS